jgi:hypothetical protein
MIEVLGDLPPEWKPNYNKLRMELKKKPLHGETFPNLCLICE